MTDKSLARWLVAKIAWGVATDEERDQFRAIAVADYMRTGNKARFEARNNYANTCVSTGLSHAEALAMAEIDAKLFHYDLDYLVR